MTRSRHPGTTLGAPVAERDAGASSLTRMPAPTARQSLAPTRPGRLLRTTLVAVGLGLRTIVLPPNADAQAPIQVVQYTADDGLAQNTVRAVVQDHHGFVWVGTNRGLQRFDGYTFTPYSDLDPVAPPELSDLIGEIQVGRGRMLLVQAGDGLFEVDPTTTRSTRLVSGVTRRAWAQDSIGNLWFVQHGRLARFDRSTKPPRVIEGDSIPIGNEVLAAGRSGHVWIAGKVGAGSGRVVRVSPSGARTTYELNVVANVLSAFEDQDQRLWIGGSEGLDVLDPQATRFRTIAALRGHEVSTIEPSNGSVLVPATTAVLQLDPQGRIIDRFESPQVVRFLPQDLAIDRDGGIWLGTFAGGLFRLDARRPLFELLSRELPPLTSLGSNFVTALHERPDGTIWIGTLNDGAYVLTRGATSVTRPGSLVAGNVWDFATDGSGRLWLGMSNGLCTPSASGFACYGVSREAPGLVDIVTAGDGWFWLARAANGANAFDPRTGRFGDRVSLPDDANIMAAYFDRDSSVLWLGGSGLFRARVAGGKVVGSAEPVAASVGRDRLVYAIFRDAQHTLWLGTENGLQRWDASARAFTPVDVPELRGSTAFSLQEDADQRLWIGTAHGLVAYSPSTGIARRYRREDGIRSGEFNRRAALRTASGEMWFGGVQGITRFHPAAISGRREAPPIVITRLRKLTADGLRDVPLVRSDTSAIRLVPGDRAVTIEFAALAYGPAPARRYRYRLERLNDEWIESGEHAVTYPTPPAGSYVFHVQAAAGSEGAWSSTSGVLNLEVIPPFSKTAWFRGLLAVTTAAILWSLHRLRLARAVATERLRLRISRDLHDQIGAGLSSIALLSDSVGSSRAGMADVDRKELRKIAGAAREMVGDLRDIVWSIDPDADRLEDVVARMRDVADDLLRGLNVTFDVQPGSHLTRKVNMGARRDLLLLYKEALHNIARHAQATAVRIVLRVDRSRLALEITDDGVGFVPGHATSGVGLRSLRERAERLGAHLGLESEPGRGTTVRLELPTT